MANVTNKGTRASVPSVSNKNPTGVTKFKDTYYSKQHQDMKGYSNNVAKALQMMDMGFKDISAFKKTLSDTDKLVLENEVALQENVKKLWDELHSKKKSERKNARRLLQLQQKDTWENFGKQMKDLQMEIYENSSMKQFLNKTQEVWERNDDAIRGVLGPLNLITKPFEEFFNFDLGAKLREKIFGGGKPSKRNPNENDVAKIGVAGAGYLYIANKFDKYFGKKGKMGDTDIDLNGFGGGSLSTIASKILSPKGLATGSLIAGLGMIVYDAVQGYFMSEEWDVGKVQATIGGALGGTGSGITNAFKKAGQYALAGAGAGAMFGPVGALVGGLGGLVIGAVGGYLGGEEISKQLQDATDVIFTDKTWSDVRGENLLADVDAKVKSGEISAQLGSAYKELSGSMSSEAFSKLGKRALETNQGNIADWIIEYGKGSFDTLSRENKGAIYSEIFGLTDPRSQKDLLPFYRWVGETFGHDEGLIADIFKDTEHTIGFIKSLKSLNSKGEDDLEGLYRSALSSGALTSMTRYLSTVDSDGKRKGKGFSERKIANSYRLSPSYVQDNPRMVSSYASGGVQSVNDAILRPDGSVIKTNPNDTLVALKDIPKSASALMENQLGLDKSLSNLSNGGIAIKLDTLIKLLQQISNKEPVQLTMPSMARQDLDLIMNGGLI